MVYRDAVYMVLDEARLVSDDMSLNEEHAIFLLDKYRALLLTKKYKSVKTEVPDTNYQMLCLDLEEAAPTWLQCDGMLLRSTKKVPNRLNIGNDVVTPYNYFKGINICLVSREQLRYAGENKFLRNIIYCAIGPDGYLYFKSFNPQFQYLKRVKFVAVFESGAEASELLCDSECELLDRTFPMEESLVNPLINAVVNELVGAVYRPKDDKNSADDDTDKIAVKKNGQYYNAV